MARGPMVESPTRKWRLVERPKRESKLGGNAKSEQTTRGVDSESDSADELIAEQEAGGSDHNEADEDEDEMVDEEAEEDEDEMFLSRHMVGHIKGSAGWKRKMMIFCRNDDKFWGLWRDCEGGKNGKN